jgi:hypothetical protein
LRTHSNLPFGRPLFVKWDCPPSESPIEILVRINVFHSSSCWFWLCKKCRALKAFSVKVSALFTMPGCWTLFYYLLKINTWPVSSFFGHSLPSRNNRKMNSNHLLCVCGPLCEDVYCWTSLSTRGEKITSSVTSDNISKMFGDRMRPEYMAKVIQFMKETRSIVEDLLMMMKAFNSTLKLESDSFIHQNHIWRWNAMSKSVSIGILTRSPDTGSRDL